MKELFADVRAWFIVHGETVLFWFLGLLLVAEVVCLIGAAVTGELTDTSCRPLLVGKTVQSVCT